MAELIFTVASALTLAGSVGVFAFRNTVYAVVSLVTALAGVAVLYFQLGAPFIGALQVILYAGAIMVLFLFVVMLLNVRRDTFGPDRRGLQKALAILTGLLLLAQLLVVERGFRAARAAAPGDWGSAAHLARAFFSRYVLAFELTSVLLLAAMVGAVVLARRGDASPPAEQET